MKTVYLEWVDSIMSPGGSWAEIELVKKRKIDRCRTIGFVVNENKNEITVIGSHSHATNEVAGSITIPKCAIRKRRIVTWKK